MNTRNRQKYDSSIYVRFTKDEHIKVLKQAYGYKSLSDYVRKKLLDLQPPKKRYKTMCNSCVDCKYLEVVGGGCKYLPICVNAIDVHANESERKKGRSKCNI